MGEAILFKAINTEGSGGAPRNEIYYSNDTYTCEYTGNYQIICVGGGGSGGVGTKDGSTLTNGYSIDYAYTWAGGGGSGNVNKSIIKLTKGTSYSITIGSGGPAKSSNGSGSSGGTTSFGSLLSATGGQGGKLLTSTKYNTPQAFNNAGNAVGFNNGWIGYTLEYDGESEWGRRSQPGYLYLVGNGLGFPEISLSGSNRLLYGDGGNGVNSGTSLKGNGGCIFINFVN